MKPLLLIYNPKAGRGAITARLPELIQSFTARGFLVTAYPTQGSYCFDALLPVITPDTLLVYAGGDGMLNAALNFHLEHRLLQSISYLPLGTTNDFARGLGLNTDPLQSLDTALSGHPVALDAGRMNERAFVYVAAFGMFTDVSYTAPQELKNSVGYLAYLLEGIRHLSELKTYHMQISWSGGHAEGEFVLGMITNSFSIAGLHNLLPADVSLTDGLLEVLLIRRPQKLLEFSDIAASLLSGKPCHSENLLRFRAASLQIHASEPLPWTLDGEYGGAYSETSVQVLPGALRIRL